MSNRGHYEEFLMDNLHEIRDAVESPNDRAHVLLTTLAAGGQDMPESLFWGYTNECDIAYHVIIPYISYFAGMMLFDVFCDCDDIDCAIMKKTSTKEWWEGFDALHEKNESYMISSREIAELMDALDL